MHLVVPFSGDRLRIDQPASRAERAVVVKLSIVVEQVRRMQQKLQLKGTNC
ncbi:hypothetical protein [Streptomyces aureus]|uniref:hypothetical protein n=1 Tax=Streptomyces aureus TaxID=193461 RepID=UPI00131DFD33|nr:hypothetical protein [Streptomyces aureus]